MIEEETMKFSEYDFESPHDSQSVIKVLNKYGISIVRNFLSDEEKDRLNHSFKEALSGDNGICSSKSGHPTNKGGRQGVVDLKIARQSGHPIFDEIAHSPLISEISRLYYAPYSCEVAANVLLTHLKPCKVPILPWHYDRLQTLKFWIYLKDARKKDGAFEYCPGTHWEGRYRTAYNLAIGSSVQNLPNDVPDERIINPVTLEAKAGDLIIFDPDGFHRGGIVEDNGERRVLRIDTHPIGRRKWSDWIFTPSWFLQTSFNLAKVFRKKSQRILGDMTSDKALNRKKHKIT